MTDEQPTSEWIKSRDFIAKEVWERNEFTRTDGSTGSVQKILNKMDRTLVIWDYPAITDIHADEAYTATGIRIRQNRDGFDEYHTGKFTTVGLRKIKDITQTTLNNTLEKKTNEIVSFEGVVTAQLSLILKKLDDLAEMI